MSRIKVTDACHSSIGTFFTFRHCVVFGRMLHLMVEQLKLGIILEERVVEPSVPQLKGQVSFECGSWDGSLKTSLKPSGGS